MGFGNMYIGFLDSHHGKHDFLAEVMVVVFEIKVMVIAYENIFHSLLCSVTI